MKNAIACMVGVFTAAAIAGGAQAQIARTFVSGLGSDNNPCTRAAPCRSFAQAITQTNAAGEITVLDSAGYGPVTISKSITITNPGGVEAGITAASGQDAITISTSAAAIVTLRGLTLEGGGVGQNGVNLNSALPPNSRTTVYALGCVIKNFVGSGILIQPSFGAGTFAFPSVHLIIADSFVLDNGVNGIGINPGTVNIVPSIYRTVASGNATGLSLVVSAGFNSIFGTAADSHFDDNKSTGITLKNSNAGIILKSSTAQSNGTSDLDNSTPFLYLHDENEIGTLNNAGVVYSDGTNNILSVNGNSVTPRARQ